MASNYPIHRQAKVTLSTGPTIAYTLFLPSPSPSKAALIAHPLGRLGGTQNDHVVRSLAAFLERAEYVVCTYDARGAGDSTGSGSFTFVPAFYSSLEFDAHVLSPHGRAAPEAEDFKEIIETVLLPCIKPTPSSDGSPAASTSPKEVDLLLCGYSFGSLASSSFHISSLSPSTLPPSITLNPRYLLISYPLSVLWALTAFRTSSVTQSLSQLVEQGYPVLVIYGTHDQFSGIDKLRKWSEGLRELKGATNKFEVVEVEGADHFWGDEELKVGWLKTVKIWLGV